MKFKPSRYQPCWDRLWSNPPRKKRSNLVSRMQTMLTLKPERLILFKLPFLPPAADEGNEDLCTLTFTKRATEQKPSYFTASKIRRERERERLLVPLYSWGEGNGNNGLSGVPLPLACFLSTPSRPLLCFRRHGENARLLVQDLRLDWRGGQIHNEQHLVS